MYQRSILFFLLLIIIHVTNNYYCYTEAGTKLEGYYEAQYGAAREDYWKQWHKWNVWDPWHNFELKLIANPVQNAEAYVKFYAKWMSDNPHVECRLQEGHLKFRAERARKGLQIKLFTRQKDYWIGNPLLILIKKKDGVEDLWGNDNGQGVRLDLWVSDTHKLIYILSDNSEQDDVYTSILEPTDNAHIIRYSTNLIADRLTLGSTYLRKVYRTGNGKSFNETVSGDITLTIKNIDYRIELAKSRVPQQSALPETLAGGTVNPYYVGTKNNIVCQAEIRGFKIQNKTIGSLNIVSGYRYYGKNYRNYFGEDWYKNNVGFFINTYYLVPQKAITITCNYSHHQLQEQLYGINGLEPVDNLYSEIYIEFIKGFKTKFYFNKKDSTFLGQRKKHYDILGELIVENELAWLKSQVKIKDWNTATEKHIFGMELSVNLTEKIKLYNRALLVNEKTRVRAMHFVSLQFWVWNNTELFVEYGPSNFGDFGELVHDRDFVDSDENMRHEMKLILKGWY